MKIRKGDTVEVLTGKDRGSADNPTRGTVLQVLPDENKVIVSGVNTATKHMKPGRRGKNNRAPQQGDQGGLVEIDMPIHVSNIAYVHNGKRVRLGYSTDAKGKKVRVAKLGDGKTEVID